MKKAMSLMLALGMFATLLAPCAAAEQATAVNSQTAETAAVAELAEETAPETPAEEAPEIDEEAPTVEELTVEEAPVEEITVEETPEEEVASDDAAEEEPTGEVSAEVSAAPGDVAIDATNFPDDNFRQYIEDNIDKDGNKVLSAAEIASISSIIVNKKDIQSLKGVEFFTALTTLSFSNNKLTTLDLSKNTALTNLTCNANQLTALDISKNTALSTLWCGWNKLTELDVSNNTALTELFCFSNGLTALDVSNNPLLEELYCYSNKLSALDVSKNSALVRLSCGDNNITALDVNKNTALKGLFCDNSLLTTLDVSKNPALTELSFYNNQLTSIDVSKNKDLYSLTCSLNLLTELDVSKNPKLHDLHCSNIKLSMLDVSKNAELIWLECDRNQLTALDVGNNTKLDSLSCYSNKIQVLDVSKCANLRVFQCYDNALPTLDTSNNPKLTVVSDDLKQTVTFTPELANSIWQYNLKELVGAENVSRVSNVKSDYGTYDAATGIITFAKAPTDATSFSYEYDAKTPNNEKMPVTAKAQVKAPSTGAEAFTDRLYSVCLGRLPDAAGKADWVDQLTNFRISGTKAAYGFVFSKEFQDKKYSNADFVEHLYEAFMGRASDAGGKAYWIKQLESGKSREEVFYGFADSVEFDKICNSYGIVSKDIETFVTRFYKVCLERMPDAGGLADWSNQLRSKTRTGRDVAYGFIFSKEFTGKNYSNEDYVEHLYAAFMGRASDAAGKADWVKQLQSGKSREDVFNGFVGSKEFGDICASYDIVRG